MSLCAGCDTALAMLSQVARQFTANALPEVASAGSNVSTDSTMLGMGPCSIACVLSTHPFHQALHQPVIVRTVQDGQIHQLGDIEQPLIVESLSLRRGLQAVLLNSDPAACGVQFIDYYSMTLKKLHVNAVKGMRWTFSSVKRWL